MNRSMVAGIALVAGMALVVPLAAFGQNEAHPAAAAPAAGPGIGMASGPGGDQAMMGRGMGPWRRGMEAMGPMGWRRGMMRRSPTERCRDRLARRAAMIAYTVTKLDLTAQQRPLWDKLNAILEAGTRKEQQLCSALQASAQRSGPTILDRVDRRERFLTAQLGMLQQARPELQKFYEALTPEQKAIINHPFRHG
jgi:LTXXQ motif family protein